jgi:hypothetical protein
MIRFLSVVFSMLVLLSAAADEMLFYWRPESVGAWQSKRLTSPPGWILSVNPEGEPEFVPNTSSGIIGPTGAVDSRIVAFDGSTGGRIKDSGYTVTDLLGRTSIPSGRIPYGTGTNITSEAAFTYDSNFDFLSVGGILLGGTAGLGTNGSGFLTLSNGFTGEDIIFNNSVGGANTMFIESSSGVSLWDFGLLSVKAPALEVGLASFVGPPRTVPHAMPALQVDLGKSLNTKTISSTVSVTFSGSLSAGQFSELQFMNTGASEYLVNLPPNVYASNGANIVGSLTVPAASGGIPGMTHVALSSDGTRLRLYQGGGSGDGGIAALTPWTTNIDGGGQNLYNVDGIEATTVTADLTDSTNIPAEELFGTVPDLTFGKITTAAALQYTPTVVAATTSATTTVDVTKTYSVVTLNETAETIAFTGTPGEGTPVLVRFVPHTSDCTVNIPSTYSLGLGDNRISFVVRANKPVLWQLWRTNTAWFSYEPIEIGDLPTHSSPTDAYLVETNNPSTGASGRSTLSQVISGTGIKTTRTGVRRTMYVNAGAMIPRATEGAARATVELATNDIMFDSVDFDSGLPEGVGFWIHLPPTWNAGALTVKYHWTASGGVAGETVRWVIRARGYADDSALDQTLGAAQSVDDTLLATGDMHISATTGAWTLAGDAAASRPVYVEVTRDTANDNLSADARLLGLVIEYTESSTEPAAQ